MYVSIVGKARSAVRVGIDDKDKRHFTTADDSNHGHPMTYGVRYFIIAYPLWYFLEIIQRGSAMVFFLYFLLLIKSRRNAIAAIVVYIMAG